MEPFDEKTIEAYYTVAQSLSRTAQNMMAQAEYLGQIADRMSEERMRMKQPPPSSEPDGH